MISLERQLSLLLSVEEGAAERASTVPRPVEWMVFRKVLEKKRYVWDYEVTSQRPAMAHLRYCVECRTKHPMSEFSRDKRVHDGWAYACDHARKRKGRVSWRRMYQVA